MKEAEKTGNREVINKAVDGFGNAVNWYKYTVDKNAWYESRGYNSIPKRKLKTKSRSQHAKKVRKTRKDKGVKRGTRKVRSTTKTRSLYAASKSKKVIKRKGMKNYLSRVLSNVTDSVKNTGKAVLSPITKKNTK